MKAELRKKVLELADLCISSQDTVPGIYIYFTCNRIKASDEDFTHISAVISRDRGQDDDIVMYAFDVMEKPEDKVQHLIDVVTDVIRFGNDGFETWKGNA